MFRVISVLFDKSHGLSLCFILLIFVYNLLYLCVLIVKKNKKQLFWCFQYLKSNSWKNIDPGNRKPAKEMPVRERTVWWGGGGRLWCADSVFYSFSLSRFFLYTSVYADIFEIAV